MTAMTEAEFLDELDLLALPHVLGIYRDIRPGRGDYDDGETAC